MRSHPGGALGQRLSGKISELMLEKSGVPFVQTGASMTQALTCMDVHRLGAVFILDSADKLIGILTDGDVRHWIANGGGTTDTLSVDEVMTRSPRHLSPDSYLYDALNLMEKYEITVLPILGEKGCLKGLLHLHDILGKGTFKFNGGNQ